ncbi:MAG: helix-turn-helix transcriptional regulator [Thermoplasmata archaeon]|nr:helix-turn-helix transcriptional regulator [Thermoplasmata archaeon]
MRGITLTKIFGSCHDVAVLERFADNYEEDLSIGDIVYMSGVPRTTVYRIIKKLLDRKVIIKTKKYGRTQLYRLNIDNEVARAIVYLENVMAQKEMEKLMEKEGMAKFSHPHLPDTVQ